MKKVLAVLAVASSVVVAQATGLGLAGEFNAFVFGNANLVGAESEGAVAVGGNFVSNQAYNFAVKSTASTAPDNASNIGLYIGGAITVAGGQKDAGKVEKGNAYVGGSVINDNLFVRHGNLNPAGSSVDHTVFTNAKAHLSALSIALAGLEAVNYVVNDFNNPEIDLSSSTKYGDLKVFNINASELFVANPGTFNALNFTGNETVVFNVYGNNINMNRNWQEKNTSFGNLASRTLWNFVDADYVTNTRQLDGTVLAVDAQFHQNELLKGGLIANTWTQGQAREIHTHLFEGDLESVPEPMTLGVLALLALRRRKKAAKAKA